jgi:hypothetical protein
MTIDISEYRAKIERARELRDALEATIPSEEEATTPRLPLSAKLERASGYYVFWVADVPQDFYLRIGVIVGEAVHNLRTALDNLFWQLASHYIGGAIPPERSEGIEFPIESTSLGFSEKKIGMPEIPSSTWAIIERAQPYNGGNFLNLLRILSDDDKHGVLKPLLMSAKAGRIMYTITIPHGTRIDFDNTYAETYLKVGAEVTRIKFTPFSPYDEEEVEVAAHITPYVQLPKGDRPVVLGLHEIILEVEEVINDLAMHLQEI